MPAREVIAVDLRQPPAVVDAFAATLDARERQDASARTGDARRRYVVAHGALRAVLAQRTGIEPAAIAFRRSCAVCGSHEHGKPAIANATGVEFSLSHSHDIAVVAVAPEPVGVDVELVRERPYDERVARRIMRADEFDAWCALTPDERPVAFLRVWTAKEAYLKLLGVGITRTLRDVQPTGTYTWAGWPEHCVTTVASAAGARDWASRTLVV
jgi:4'-phosphopantetheinyl transferase